MSHKRATTFGSRKKKSNAQIASGISGLELLHETTMSSIEASNKDVSAPSGKNYNFQFHEKKNI